MTIILNIIIYYCVYNSFPVQTSHVMYSIGCYGVLLNEIYSAFFGTLQ